MKKSKRTLKNVVLIAVIGALCATSALTINYAKNNSNPSFSKSDMQTPSDFNRGFPGASSDSSDSESSESGNQPSETPGGVPNSDSSSQPPTPPSGDSNSDSSNQPPTPPSGDSNSDSSNQPPTPPSGDSNGNSMSLPSSQSSSDNSFNQSRNMSDSGSSDSGNLHRDKKKSGKKLSILFYALFGVQSLLIALIFIYLIMSGFNKKGLKETFKKSNLILIYALAVILAASVLTAGESVLTNKLASDGKPNFSQSFNMNQSSASVEASGATSVDGNEQTLEASYSSTESDESAILVTNGGNATIKGATVDKSSGDSSNTENSEFYGVNAGILVQADSTATIKNATISTSAKGSNAVFSTGENSKIYISDSTITTTGESSSRGLDATYGGYIEADNVTVKTQGGSCAALATDRGEGTVIANNSKLETNGKGSPIIYSTGNISIDNTTAAANGAQNVVIEGKNSATITNSTLSASGAGNRGDVDIAGVMIYQSMSGDASEGTGTLTAENSSISIMKNSDYYKTAPMFFITNTNAEINLTNTKLSFGSGVLLSAEGTSEWGSEGSNGGNVTLNATNQSLKGNIEVDKISTASINLTKSTYTGTINGENSAKEITLKLDKDSKITLTGDSYVTSLENADTTNGNINFNGYKLYVNGKAIN